MQESTLGAALVFAAAACFGTIGIFGELAARIEFPLRTMLPARFVVATAAVLALAWFRDWDLPSTERDWLATLALGVVYTGLTLLYFVSLRTLTAGLATIVLYTYPAFVVVLSTAFLGEPVTVRKVVALSLATAGVALVVGTDAGGAEPVGVALALGSAVCYAVYTTGSRSVLPEISPRGLMVGVLLGTTASMAVYGVLAGGVAVPGGRTEWGLVLGLATVSTVLPQVLFYEGVARLEASRAGVVSTVEPVVTVALGAVLLGEPVTRFVVVGGGLVLAGVVLVQYGRGDTAEPSSRASRGRTE